VILTVLVSVAELLILHITYILQVHGGTSSADIERKVEKAVEQAKHNQQMYPGMQTVLFFDEANTTEDIGLIKEIMCDRSRGSAISEMHDLKLIAACNPYRKYVAAIQSCSRLLFIANSHVFSS
jgi:hypothetical protein